MSASTYVDAIRRFNRFYTQVIGLLREGMHQSAFTLPEARVIYELGRRRTAMTSRRCSMSLRASWR